MSARHKNVTTPLSSLGQCCAGVREVLGFVGDKWSVLIVVILSDGPLRFSELRNQIDGISQRMLTRTLRGLERDGILTRTVEPSVPPKVYYELTQLGKTLLDPVQALAEWAQANHLKVQQARKTFDKTHGTED